jgi:hypothetical protein
MPDEVALVRMPDPQLAPGYRRSLGELSHFTVADLGGGIVAVAPAEGAGGTAEHFGLHKLCDAGSDLADAETWSKLREHPPRATAEDPRAFRQRMIALGELVRERRPGVEGEMVAFNLAAMGAAQTGELPDLLAGNLEPLFTQFPQGSLWQVTVSPVLLARLAFGRAQFAFQVTPDIPIGPEMERLSGASGLGLGAGVDFAGAMTVPLLALSPAVLGFLVPAMPHMLVFCFGQGVELRRVNPISFASMYRPGVLSDPAGLEELPTLEALEPQDGPSLLAWWVGQLNRLYSHATDPTRFTDGEGYHDAAAQMAWMITLERLLGDALSLLAEPQASDLQRVQIAFDLLDKAESVIGYGRNNSGKGFEALLRRRRTIRRLREAYSSLPGTLGQRLGDEAERLFDGLYAEVYENTVTFRRRPKGGAEIAKRDPRSLVGIDDETLVAALVRAVRNSSHGLLDILHNHDDRFLLAANTGGIPAELPALAPLIAVGIVADADSLIDGSWKTKLAEQVRAKK